MTRDRRSRWQDLTGGTSGVDYAARFAKLAASGADMHGEATYCAAVAWPGARFLDAGCGTGRVAIRLAEQGFARRIATRPVPQPASRTRAPGDARACLLYTSDAADEL